MKNLLCVFIFVFLLAGSFAINVCAQGNQVVPLKGLDPVVLVQGKEEKGQEKYFVARGKFKYLFANEKNQALFEANPEQYEIQRGGECATMQGAKADPELFMVYEGKIYLFGTSSCLERFKRSPEGFIKPDKTLKVRNVAIFLFQGVELLDFAGPGEVFAVTRTTEGKQAFRVYTVAASSEPIVSQGFITIQPQYTIENCPKPDIMVIPGGNMEKPLQDPKVMEWIKTSAIEAEITMSVCTGAYLLARTGLLKNKKATTHWTALNKLRSEEPTATVLENTRFVDSGKVLTTAGVSAGIDGALYVVERLLGKPAASVTAMYMEYESKAVKQP